MANNQTNQPMKEKQMKNLVFGTLILVVIGLAVTLVRTNQQLNERSAEVQALKTAKPATPAKVFHVATAPAAPTPTADTTAPKPAAPKSFQSGFGTNFMQAIAGLMKNPLMKETMKAQQKAVVDKMYGDLLKSINLTDEQKNQFHEMLIEKQQLMAEAGLTMISGTPEEKKKATELIKEAQTGYNQVVNDLFGAEAATTYKQYEDHLPEHSSLAMFKGSLASADALSAQQESDLIGALYEERKNMPADSLLNKQRGQPPDPSQLTEEQINSTMQQMEQLQQRNLARAAAILTPTQLEQYKQYQKQMANMQAMGLKMAVQMFGQPKSSAGTP